MSSSQWKCHTFHFDFSHLRALPSPETIFCHWGLWELWVPFNQPGHARKRQTLHAASGSVRVQSSIGELHTPDQTNSLRCSCSLCGPQPQEASRPQVRELSMLLQWCLCRILIYPRPKDICTVAQCVHLISVKKQKSCLFSDWSACQVEVQPVKRMK